MNVSCLRLGETVRYREGERDVSVCGESGCLLGACEAAQVQSGSPDVDGKATQRAGMKESLTSLGSTSFVSQWHSLVGMAKSQESLIDF